MPSPFSALGAKPAEPESGSEQSQKIGMDAEVARNLSVSLTGSSIFGEPTSFRFAYPVFHHRHERPGIA
jgi:hypothetical protein